MDRRKRCHLVTELKPDFAVARMEELKGVTAAMNLAAVGGPRMAEVPDVDILDAGFPCKSRSAANANASAN
eukprot:6383079-Pyramimonas_sp.AAC.1